MASLSSSNGRGRKGLYGGRSASRMNGKFSLYVVCVFFGVVVLTFLLDASSFSRQAVDFGGRTGVVTSIEVKVSGERVRWCVR